MTGFIAVHLGAGHHSADLAKAYKTLCYAACKSASEILERDGSAMDAAEAAMIVLENSALTNAGYGSTLTWDGLVECDASIMSGATLHFGACGAVPNVRNPIALAKAICMKQAHALALGRVPPCVLTGVGARRWAERAGLELADDASMTAPGARRKYSHYKRKLKKYCRHFNVECTPLDTVGAVCADSRGDVVAAASSGGVALKHSGRVGQAASFASGVWAEAAPQEDSSNTMSVAACTSGCGEHLIRTQFAKSVAASLRDECPTTALADCFARDFCDSPFLRGVREKLGGAIGLRHDGQCGEFLWGHTTPSMCVGYKASGDSRPKFVMSKLPPNMKVGCKAVVGGVPFSITLKKPPLIQWIVLSENHADRDSEAMQNSH